MSEEVAKQIYCLELFRLTGWGDTDFIYCGEHDEPVYAENASQVEAPAYDLGYLLRKLPTEKFARIYVETDVDPDDEGTPGWSAGVLFKEPDGGTFFGCYGTTPENALCHLAIELYKDGWLK